MKKLIILGVAFLCLSLAPSVLANDDGPVAKAYDFKYAEVLSLNFGSAHNHIWTDANTGRNMNFMWWGGDKTKTGDATARGTVDTSLNSSDTDVLLTAVGDGPVALNVVDDEDDHCGWPWSMWWKCGDLDNEDSNPVAIAKSKTKVKVYDFNFGSVCNGVFTKANSGHNWNMGWGLDTDTGDAMATANVDTTLNSSDTNVTYIDSQTGPMAMNVEEGDNNGGFGCHNFCYKKNDDNGDAVAVAIDKTYVKVKSKNYGHVGNFVMTAANSGHNYTMGGESGTGDATARSSVSTAMNNSSTTVSVTKTGDGSLAANMNGGSKAVAVEENKVEVENKNMGSVNNHVMTSANTGSNYTKKSSDSDTGDATAASTVTNTVNSSDVSVAVNDNSSPTAVNSDGSETMVETPCDGPVSVCGDGGPTAANLGEDGTAVAKDESKVEVENENVAHVSNNVSTSANSGDNTTEGSYCGGEADTGTGDATATSTVENTVNDSSTDVVINW